MSTAVIEAAGLTKRYPTHTAVDGIDLTINEGEVFGILGPNGAGKTTTILMLLGLTDITEGSVEVVGMDPTRDPLSVKRVVGYMPDTVGFYDNLSARDNLAYSGRLAGIGRNEIDARIDAALERVRLLDVADRKSAAFSRGMRQRLGLAEIIMKQPRVAILDEPTSGLDPQSAKEFLELIKELKAEGMTIVLSSHLLDRVQAICDRVALFHNGKIALQGNVRDLAKQVLGGSYRIDVEARGINSLQSLKELDDVLRVEPVSDNVYSLEAARDVRAKIAAKISQSGGDLLGLSMREPSLEEVYNTYFEEMKDAA